MRTSPPPGKKRVSDWIGLKVRLVRDLSNGYAKYPKGMVATVRNVGPGLQLQREACKLCGCSMYIARVHSSDIEVVT
jgi:hypothetical protein